jgi:hypothetical protein
MWRSFHSVYQRIENCATYFVLDTGYYSKLIQIRRDPGHVMTISVSCFRHLFCHIQRKNRQFVENYAILCQLSIKYKYIQQYAYTFSSWIISENFAIKQKPMMVY